MQKFLYISSPLTAARLVEAGFSCVRSNLNAAQTVFMFEVNQTLLEYVQQRFTAAERYKIVDGARVNF